jgi:hypothetical protein
VQENRFRKKISLLPNSLLCGTEVAAKDNKGWGGRSTQKAEPNGIIFINPSGQRHNSNY